MSGGGTQRSNIFPGAVVAIVLKSDQGSGFLTHGTVQTLLTNSENHPRGIKVRLTSGQVGRVQKIHPQGTDCESIQPRTGIQHQEDLSMDLPRAPPSRNLGDFLFPNETSRTTATMTISPWSCATCTFENNNYELECEMCNTLRPNYRIEDE
mmetsp:Transcript_11939/g.22113  ORF Transcript_11939/g.22113 Transcript_11939/m.22113 type:complete len:152 (-) Transcript_11939:216-671(-)